MNISIFQKIIYLYEYFFVHLRENASSFLYKLAYNYNLFAARQQLRKSRFFLLSGHRRAICIFNYNKKHRFINLTNTKTVAPVRFSSRNTNSLAFYPLSKKAEKYAHTKIIHGRNTRFSWCTQYFLCCYSFGRIYRVFLQDGDLCAHAYSVNQA